MKCQAYVFIKVAPPNSPKVAQNLSKDPAVLYAAAVWGPWDVGALVQTTSLDALIKLVEKVHRSYRDANRTETYLIRPDQHVVKPAAAPGGRLAFLLLKVEARATLRALDELRSSPHSQLYAEMLDVAGILGPYDVALTMQYFNDSQLSLSIMSFIQQIKGVRESLTIPSIQAHVYVDGKRVG